MEFPYKYIEKKWVVFVCMETEEPPCGDEKGSAEGCLR